MTNFIPGLSKKATSVIVGFTTVAMMLSAVVVPASASADTLSDLMAQIAALQAQIASLSGQTSTGTGYVFTKALTVGSRNEDVRQLQMILNSDPSTMVALTGVGSAGNESMYFGSLTKAAVMKFQAKNGISTTGTVGPLTRAKLNSMSVVTTPVPGTPGTPAPVMDGTDGSVSASLNSYAGNTTIKKGETKDMAAIKLTATVGKVTVNRFDVEMSVRPYLYFSKIVLKDSNGNVIATKNISGASDVTEVTVGSKYLVRFDNVNAVVTPGTDLILVVAGTVLATTDKLSSDVTVNVGFNSTAIRTVNGKGYTDTLGLAGIGGSAGTDYRVTTLSSTGSAGNIVVKANASQSARVVNTSTSGETKEVVLGQFDFKAENQAATINTLKFNVKDNLGGSNASSTIYKSLKLVDGSTVYNVDAMDTTSTFSNLQISIPLDNWKTVTLKADVADADNFTNGVMASTTITANTTNVVGLDVNYNTVTVTSATPVTPNITFLSTGASVSGLTAVKTAIDNGSSAVSKYAVDFGYTFANTGSNDLYISKEPSTALATSTTASSSRLTLVTASGTNSGDTATYWVVSAGQSRTFTYTGVMDNTNGTSGAKEFKITRVYFDDDTTGLQESNIDFGLDALRVTAVF